MKKTLFFLIVLGFLSLACAAITTQTWTLFESSSMFWAGIGRDWTGDVYAGIGNHRTDDNANSVVYKYNFAANNWDQVMNCKTVSQNAGNWLPLDRPGKIHSNLKQGLDGRIYFSTHSAYEQSDDVTAYPQQFRGGHFYAYDPRTGSGVDVSAAGGPKPGILNQGILDIAVATQYNLVYGDGYPYGSMCKQDMVTGDTTFLWDTQSRSGQISRNVLDDNYGRFLYPGISKRFIIYDPVSDSVTFDKFRHSHGTQIGASVKSWTGDSIYYIMIENGNSDVDARLFRYIVSRDTAQCLGYIDSGNGSYKASMAYRWDLNKVYVALGNRLVSFNVLTGARTTEYSALPTTGYGWYGCNGVDKNGDLYFTSAGGRSVMKVTLNQPCAICSQRPKCLDPVYVDSVDRAWRQRTAVENSVDMAEDEEAVITAQPNPFNPTVTIAVRDNRTQMHIRASLRVFDTNGRIVADLVQTNANGSVVWDASNFSSGIYVIVAHVNGISTAKRVTLIK